MDRFEKELKRMAKEDYIDIPSDISAMIDDVLESLPDEKVYKPKQNTWRLSPKIALASISLILCLLLNAFPTIAYSMADIPIIGTIIKIITVREYQYDDGHHNIDIEVPSVDVEGNKGEYLSNYINSSIDELTTTLLDEFNKEYLLVDEKGYGSLKINYDIITNNDNWFTLRITVLEIAGSSNTFYKFYHINKVSGEIVRLSDLFKENSKYIEVISDNIYFQMVEQMERDDSVIYMVNGETPETEFHAIKEDQNFYFSDSGNIVIVFGKYEVAPGMMGLPEFEIEKTIYSEYLR